MKGKYRAFWLDKNDNLVVLDQRLLPFEEKSVTITNAEESVEAIENMTVRGAGVIGNVAGFGVYLASRECDQDIKRLRFITERGVCNADEESIKKMFGDLI
jgi:methylthioribose-1-phosphate isomerase